MLEQISCCPSKSNGIAIFGCADPLTGPPRRTRQLIELAVTRVFGVHPEAIAGTSRGKAQVAQARQVAMYLAHVACSYNLTQVGEIFARDRTTVAHACMIIEDRRDEPQFDRVIGLLEQSVAALIEPRTDVPQWQH